MIHPKASIVLVPISLLMGLLLAFPSLAAETDAKGKFSVGEKKWFPGHYVMLSPDTYLADNKSYRVLRGADGKLFQGLFMYVTWGQIENTQGSYAWDKIDALLNALPEGKKIAFSLSWQGWGGVQACPKDMLNNPAYDGGQRERGAKQASGRQLRSGVQFATIHMPSTMDRYLTFTKAFAERYDADPRLAFVTTAEIPYEASLKVGQYNEATARANMQRLAEMVKQFPRTPCGVLGAWWAFGGPDSEKDKFAKAILDAGGGFGFPDLDGTMAGGHYNSNFRPHVLANAGKWPCWMGVEWQDLMPERAGKVFPDNQITSANLTKTNFIWWITSNRRKEGGYDFDTDVLNYLCAHPNAGITTSYPSIRMR
ncbi:MAG: hypothetical protein NTX50_32870 [Candidatus Sumerlaeota bacterium]|nr:hypothetical protein [Candidatus Sumerlaeota bacterium]